MFWRGEAIEESMKQMNPYFYEVMEANQRYEKFKETNNDRLKAGLQPLPFTMNDTILSKAPLEKFLSNQNGIDKSFSGQSFLKSIKKLIKKQ